MKLHSQGPNFYREAEEAYNELFRSEIFTYPESFSESRRLESYGDDEELDEDDDDYLIPSHTVFASSTDGGPSSLPQILYLAYKNHGLFLLDSLKSQLIRLEHDIRADGKLVSSQYASNVAYSSLVLLIEALDRDDSDLELWRRVSRIAGFLGSRRIARFCLEAVLDTDDGDLASWTEPVGLEESFAFEQLKPLLRSLDDKLSRSQISAKFDESKDIITLLKKSIDPCPYLPALSAGFSSDCSKIYSKNQTINVPMRTWASCGNAILYQLSQETKGLVCPEPGASYSLVLPLRRSAEILPPPPKRITNSEVIADIDRSSPIQNGHEHRPRNAGVRNVILTAFPQTGPEESPVPVDESFLNQLIKSPNRINHTEPSVAEKGLKKANSDEQQTIAQRVNTDVGPVALPTRKRSSEMAELPETTDIGRSRSKRIRARGSIDPDSVKNNTAEDWSQWYEQQLQIYLEADGPAFGTIERVLAKLGLKSSGSLKRVRDIVSNRHMSNQASSPDAPREAGQIAPQDLSITLDGWDLPRSRAFLNGHDPKDPAGGASGTSNSGFTSFLEHSSQQSQTPPERDILSGDVGLDGFAERTDKQEWLNVHQLAFQWLVELLGQETFPNSVAKSRSLYVDYIWPDKLKAAVVQMLVIEDEAIYSETKRIVEDLGKQKYSEELHDANPLVLKSVVWFKRTCTEFVQTIFELHLDVYGRITNPSSEVDASTRLLQRDRLCRWAAFSSKVMNGWSWPGHSLDDWGPSSDHLRVRFMWASVVCTSLLEPASRDHTILCFQDMIRILEELGAGQATRQIVIELPNNAIMPELSIEIAEKEISRLTTMDFFMGIFSSENNDPLAIIEALEPLLQLSIARRKSFSSESEEPVTTAMAVDGQPVEDPLADHKSEGDFEDSPSPKLFEASQFLDRGNLPLRLFLWQKLRDAYQAIHYPPQVLSCNLRSFALIVNHLSSSSYVDSSPNTRQENLLRWLHRLDDLMTRVLALALSNNSVFEPFECLDGDHVRTSLESLTKLRDILHVFALWEDTIRVGQTQAPIPANLAANKGLAKSTDKFRDMIVKTWTLQYALLKEAIAQNLQLFDDHNEILLQYLKQAHQALGLRCYCSLANKIFLRLMKKELEGSRLAERWDIDMAQLVFDLYGLKISTTSTEMQDHGCIAEELDRHTALEIVDLVMLQTNRMNIKDLLKSDLKFAVDKMQQVIKISKTVNATARTFNSRLVNNYLKSPINPIDLYRSLRGIGGLPARPVNTEGTEIAAKGWYFLLGHIALTKFRSQKRSSAGSMDDLEIARTFFRHDLEFDIDKWETWYRLAQVYDTMIEEDSTWTADKLDNHMEELAVLQRKAIHCYAMAIAVATRGADASFEGTSKIADLRADFGTRIYASTREPFSMQAFSLEGFKRPYNRAGSGMYEDCPFRSLPLYPAWKLASTLLRQASNQKPQNWLLVPRKALEKGLLTYHSISYTLGKVLWKMHNCSEEVRGLVKRTDHQPVIDTLVRAIESCPEKRDSRHPDKDPILEPHYKLVSVVHKLVHSKRIPVSPTEYTHADSELTRHAGCGRLPDLESYAVLPQSTPCARCRGLGRLYVSSA